MKNTLRCLLACLLFISSSPFVISAQEPEFPTPATRTLVADVLDVEGEYIIVRGELGEIRIEVREDTKISEAFQFGDRVKAILRPNDTAISVQRAAENEPTGFQKEKPKSTTVPPKVSSTTNPLTESPSQSTSTQTEPPSAPLSTGPKVRIIVADLLMVDGDFYVVRSNYGEIRIEATPDTTLTEAFDFGDRIKAKVLSNDRAISIERAKPEDPLGIQTLESSAPRANLPSAHIQKDKPTPKKTLPMTITSKAPKNSRTIVADVLMVDGDFIIVRGERGEIQIEVTTDTEMNETFDYGDKIKAIVSSNDKALSVQRAHADEPIGITKH